MSEDVNATSTPDPLPDPPPDQLPEKRIRRPTWKVRESMQDVLPEGPGVLNSPDNTAAGNIGPTSPNSGPVSPHNPPQSLIKLALLQTSSHLYGSTNGTLRQYQIPWFHGRHLFLATPIRRPRNTGRFPTSYTRTPTSALFCTTTPGGGWVALHRLQTGH